MLARKKEDPEILEFTELRRAIKAAKLTLTAREHSPRQCVTRFEAHQMSGDVLCPIPANNAVHLVFQTKFQLLQPMLFQLLFGSKVRLGFYSLKLLVILRMLIGQTTEFFIRFHQMRS